MQPMQEFVNHVWNYYDAQGRHDMPWRQPATNGTFDPYAIMVSEIMLQQTQVARVTPKFLSFMQQFPDPAHLAAAPLSDVLVAWSGLGYNRRAKFLWQASRTAMQDFGGALPTTVDDLVKLPGIGKNTAGAIAAYAYNQPVTFIETNVRTVFIHHFFKDSAEIADKQLAPLLEEAMNVVTTDPARSPRTWHWALMDYGSYLKQQEGNASRRSKHYAKQSKFEGSRRQIRGVVLKMLAETPQTGDDLRQTIADERLMSVLEDLAREEIISYANDHYYLGTA